MSGVYLTYIYYEIKKRLSNKALLSAELVVALLLIAALFPLSILIAQETSRVSRFTVAIVDEDNSIYTQLFMGQILSSPSIQNNLEVVLTDRQEASRLLERDEIAGMIIIPAIFTQNMQSGLFTPLELYLNSNMPLQARLIEEGMKSGAYLMSTVQNALFTVYEYAKKMPITQDELDRLFNMEMLVLISQALDRNELYSREGKTPWANLSMIEYYMLSLPALLLCSFGCGIIFNYWEDEKNNFNKRLLLMRVTYFQITFGKAIASALILFLQGACIFLPLLFAGENYLYLLPMIMLISVQISLFNAIIGFLVKGAAGAFVSIIASLLMAMASGTIIPVYFFPSFIPEGIKLFTPHFWWQRALVALHTQGRTEYIAMLLAVLALIVILRGVIYARYDSHFLYNTKRA